MLKQVLNHVDRDITGVYNHNRYAAQKRAALDTWGRELKRIVSSEKGERGIVVPFTESS